MAMAGKKKVRAALIGFGGMGHFHASCYAKQKDVELVAICDIDEKKFAEKKAQINLGASGETSLRKITLCTSYEELTANVQFDMLDICLPCHLHAEYAIRAMEDGYHVLCEKPMARTSEQAEKMIEVSKKTGKKLMIAQCLRFMPSYCYLKDVIESGEFGSLLRLDMRRNGALPDRLWYHDFEKSGGALLDLHLHDTDFINSVLGAPESVHCYGIARQTGGVDDLMTAYTYKDGPIVNSEGSWCKGVWHCSTIAVFQNATVELNGTAEAIVYLVDNPKPQKVKFRKSLANAYFNEIAYFAACVRKGEEITICTPESTLLSIRIAEAEEKSARTMKRVKL